MSDESTNEKTRLYFIRHPDHHLEPVEKFLRNREFETYSAIDFKEALTDIIRVKPHFVFVCMDHTNRKIAAVPKLLTQSFPVVVIPFIYSTAMNSVRLLQNSHFEYKLFPPNTGPSIQRLINKIKKDEITQAKEKKEKGTAAGADGQAQGGNAVASQFIRIGGANSGKQDWNVRADDAKIALDSFLDGHDNTVSGDGLSQMGDGLDQGGYQPNSGFGSGQNQGGSGYNPNQSQNQGGSGYNPYQSGNNSGSVNGQVDPVFDENAPNNRKSSNSQNGDNSVRGMNSTSSQGNFGGAVGGYNSGMGRPNSMGKNSNADGDSFGPSDRVGGGSQFPGVRGAPTFPEDEDSNPNLMKKNSNSSESALNGKNGEQTDSSVSGKLGGSKDSGVSGDAGSANGSQYANGDAGAVGSETGKTKSVPTFIGKNRDKTKLEEGVEDSLIHVSGGNYSEGGIERVTRVSNAACLAIESPKFTGYLVAAFGSQKKIDPNFVTLMKQRLMQFLASQGEEVKSDEKIDIKIKEVEFEAWAVAQAEFLKKSVHNGNEVAMAFFPTEQANPKIQQSTHQEMMQVSIDDISEEKAVEFDLFIYLPSNNKYILYTHDGEYLGGEQKSRLKKRGVTHMHFHKDAVQDFKKYNAEKYLDGKIDEYEKKAQDQKAKDKGKMAS